MNFHLQKNMLIRRREKVIPWSFNLYRKRGCDVIEITVKTHRKTVIFLLNIPDLFRAFYVYALSFVCVVFCFVLLLGFFLLFYLPSFVCIIALSTRNPPDQSLIENARGELKIRKNTSKFDYFDQTFHKTRLTKANRKLSPVITFFDTSPTPPHL